MLLEQADWLPQYKNINPVKIIDIGKNSTKEYLPIPKESMLEELWEFERKIKDNKKTE